MPNGVMKPEPVPQMEYDAHRIQDAAGNNQTDRRRGKRAEHGIVCQQSAPPQYQAEQNSRRSHLPGNPNFKITPMPATTQIALSSLLGELCSTCATKGV